MPLINRIALIVGVLTIIAATTVSILAIWNVVEDSYLVWRSLATLGVVFLAVVLTVTVNNLVGARAPGGQDPGRHE